MDILQLHVGNVHGLNQPPPQSMMVFFMTLLVVHPYNDRHSISSRNDEIRSFILFFRLISNTSPHLLACLPEPTCLLRWCLWRSPLAPLQVADWDHIPWRALHSNRENLQRVSQKCFLRGTDTGAVDEEEVEAKATGGVKINTSPAYTPRRNGQYQDQCLVFKNRVCWPLK